MEYDLKSEIKKIKNHINTVLRKTDHNKVIIGLSGGIDSTTVLYLLKETIPLEKIYIMHLPYFLDSIGIFKKALSGLNIPENNVFIYSIKNSVDVIANNLHLDIDGIDSGLDMKLQKVRLGNIMARIRMTMLFDFAKKLNALVCGTENRTEKMLGYFTRFGDSASDFEIINHLYKTQVYKLARYLKVPKDIIETKPSAGLWKGQTDEDELGFTYSEIDQVLEGFFDKKKSIPSLIKSGLTHAKQILDLVEKQKYKSEVPYAI